MHNFKKLNIWTNSVELVTDIYHLTNTFSVTERFGLVSQLQHAAASVPTNIAEGSAKSSMKDFGLFLEISIGSTFELETELLVTHTLLYIEKETHNVIQYKLLELQKMIIGFKKTLK